jgi:hypothetical protein
LADQPFAAFCERNNGRSESAAFAVDDNGRLTAFNDCDHGIRGAEVYSYCLGHKNSSLEWVEVARCKRASAMD